MKLSTILLPIAAFSALQAAAAPLAEPEHAEHEIVQRKRTLFAASPTDDAEDE